MYNKIHYIIFVLLQGCIGPYVYLTSSYESSKNGIIAYLVELPLWAFFTFYKMPKVEIDLKDKWRDKFLFCLFLGFGTSALFLIIGQIIASFFAAVTGLNMGRILIGSFIPFHLISLVLSTWFFSKEIERLNYFGLEYQSNMGESESDDELIDNSEIEKLTTLFFFFIYIIHRF